jgi:DNA-binding NarL/FixJ family response regulator
VRVCPATRPDANGGAATATRPLTDRQLEILTNVARGRTNRQIGEILGISEKTVRNHLRTISHKLSTSDRTHAVVLAIGNGWIPIPIEPDGEPMSAREPTQRMAAGD